MQERLEKRQATKQFIDEFMKERERWKEEEAQRQAEEDKAIEEYVKLQQERIEQNLKNKQAASEEKNQIYERVNSSSHHGSWQKKCNLLKRNVWNWKNYVLNSLKQNKKKMPAKKNK